MKKIAAILAGLLVLAAASLLLAAEVAPLRLLLTIYGEENTGEFNQPQALSCGQYLTVADTANKRLLLFGLEGDRFKYVGRIDAGGSLAAPFCVAELPGGKLLVAERGKAALSVCDPKTNTAAPLQIEGTKAATRSPGRFCTGEGGRIYLIDQGLKRLLVISPEMRLEGQVTVEDKGFTGFNDVRVDRKGNILALETLRGLVHVFDPSLKRVRSFGSRETLEFPVSVAADYQGNIYVLDGHRAQVLAFDPEGRLQWRLGGEGPKEGSFFGPSYLALDRQGRLFVADRLNNRIQVFAPQRPM